MAESSATNAAKPLRLRYIVGAIVALLTFAGIVVLVAGALSGWFNGGRTPTHVVLSPEYINTAGDAIEDSTVIIDDKEFDQLIANHKTFIVLSHLPGCTANILSYINQYAASHHILYTYYPWSSLRETSYHEQIQYAPTVALFSEGQLVTHLRADSNDDIEKYNNYDAFAAWLDSYL